MEQKLASIKELKEGEFRKTVARGVVVAGFWAPWCHVCHAVMPVLEKVSDTFADKANFFKVNVVENPGIASQYAVLSLPNILIFRDGKVATQIIGSTSRKTIEESIKKVL